jgi:hypothetical protein
LEEKKIDSKGASENKEDRKSARDKIEHLRGEGGIQANASQKGGSVQTTTKSNLAPHIIVPPVKTKVK